MRVCLASYCLHFVLHYRGESETAAEVQLDGHGGQSWSEGKAKRILMYKIDSFRKIWERQVLHWKWCPYTIPKRSGRVLFRLGPPNNIRCALIVRHNCLTSFSNNPFCTHLYHIERDAFCDICVRLHAMSTFKKSSRNYQLDFCCKAFQLCDLCRKTRKPR